jgi:hypothetical protein
MQIRFETSLDDYLAFVRYHHAHSPATRGQHLRLMLTIPAIITFLVALYHWKNNPGFNEVVIGVYLGAIAVISIPWVIFMYWYFPWAIIRNTRKLLGEGSNRVMLGWRELELVGDKLVLHSELIDTRLDLRAIQKIVSTDRYTFVYLGATSAYIIPMNLYPEDEYRQFVDKLQATWNDRDHPQLSPESRRATEDRITERPR